ncbi:Rha family transcriptional regulator, partial [Weissella paramesenteroides]|uniref:Rha family transcriptional regulator n=1 Tax=Weissella paramesenteroides TaxID=1249 RepID=UPI00223BA8AE
MKDLVMQGNIKEGIYTTETIIAKYAHIERRSLMKVINKYSENLKKFGTVRFEIAGHGRKTYKFNEQQATYLLTLLDNTEPVIEFKIALVKAFYELREEVANQRVLLERNKQINKDLGQVIHEYLP